MAQNRYDQYANDQFSGIVKSVSGSQNQESKSAKEEQKRKLKEKAEKENQNLWQFPFVDVFKHFKVFPASDWKLNKKQGEVEEYFAKEIGRRAFQIEGAISANNYLQIPHPNSNIKTLGLTTRYIYFQVKCPRHGLPFSYNIELGIAERSQGLRISISNLFKNFSTSNGFVIQVPLELKNNCWTNAVIDIYEIIKQSQILPSTYLIDGSYQIKQISVCANTHIRGIYTSDNLYDFVTLPADMRFKFLFELQKWMEFFDWKEIPKDWQKIIDSQGNMAGDENMNLENLIDQQKTYQNTISIEEQRIKMRQEIDIILEQGRHKEENENQYNKADEIKKKKYDEMQRQLQMQFNSGQTDNVDNGYQLQDEYDVRDPSVVKKSKSGMTGRSMEYRVGQFHGSEHSKSHKLQKDPIMELKHIIGYQADKCHQIKWSRINGENVAIFTSGGTLIAMDTELYKQKRFFFGHSAPICCFDLNKQGTMIASAQEQQGKNSIIRLWDYATARCITMMTMPVISIKCLTFSYDGNYLASVGKEHFFMRDKKDAEFKDPRVKELIVIWDISKVNRGEQPQIIQKQTSEFNILNIKFSPIDSTKLQSCGLENIRFWKIKQTGNIRGSAVVLNNYARNTVFTCLDISYKLNEKNGRQELKVFVGSKLGSIFVVDYEKETLESTFKTNDGAILGIGVNNQFCVIGSDDSYLRVWPLDFSDFQIEAQHDGTICAVDISSDGLKIVCGSLQGTLGVLDKSNSAYRFILRSHNDEILAIEYHMVRGILITASKDKTVRLWDLDSYDEKYEYEIEDQPLSIAPHPFKATFACGFQSGKIRIIDIDSRQILDEFSQFNKPLKSLKYDNNGKFLIACSQDGQVCIHNADRQHLAIKIINLEMPPEFVHIAFTERTNNEYDNSRQRFGVMGEYGNNIMIYDTESFLVQNQIMIYNIVKFFKFANNNNDLIVVTKDCNIRFYNISRYEGVFMREITNCHRGSISGMDVSQNSGYLLTSGQDNMVKIWDYEAQQTISYYFQSFIGHTYPITGVIFNPKNNNQIISVSERDGIFIWEFSGDIDSDYKSENIAGQDLQSITQFEEKGPNMLEKIRTQNKAKKEFRNQMKEDSFFVPQFKILEQCNIDKQSYDFIETPNLVKMKRADKKLTYNHYANCSKQIKIETEQQQFQEVIEQKTINGYDGFGGVHDNLIWNLEGGLTFFTLNNKFIIEETKERKQWVFSESTVQLSCLSSTIDYKLTAAAEGSENPLNKFSNIYLYDTENKKFKRKLGTFHQKGVQSMAFTKDSKILITLGVQEESKIAIFDIYSSFQVVQNYIIKKNWANQIKIDFTSVPSYIRFVTVGNNASLNVWKYDVNNNNIETNDVVPHENIVGINFLSCDFTQKIQDYSDVNLLVIGADDGTLLTFDLNKNDYIDLNNRKKLFDGQIGVISINNNTIVAGSSKGIIYHYQINGRQTQPEDIDFFDQYDCNSAIVSITMDEFNNEGLLGTEAGQIFYVNFADKMDQVELPVKIVSSINNNQDAINYSKFDPENSNLFVVSCGKKSEDFKMYTNENCDEIMRLQSNLNEDGYVVFVISCQQGTSSSQTSKLKNKRVIGFSNGYIKRANFKSLDFENIFKLPLNNNEKLTCGFYCDNGCNILVGTNQGTLFIISLIDGKGKKKNVDTSYVRIENVGKCNNFDTAENKVKTHTKLNSDIINDTESIDIERADSQQDFIEYTGITMIRTPFNDPIGTILISFDDGNIRLWQSSKNDQVIKILELQQAMQIKKSKEDPKNASQSNANKPALYDISDFGYQQFDLKDIFDIFKVQIDEDFVEFDPKSKFQGKKYPSCQARFPPFSSKLEQYFCFVDAIQMIFIRDFTKKELRQKISLNFLPTCMVLLEFHNKIQISEDSHLSQQIGSNKFNILAAIGSQCGKIYVYKFNIGKKEELLLQSKAGISYGAITALDVMSNGTLMIAATESGEIIMYELLNQINQ